MTNIYQQIWDADQLGNGVKAIKEKDPPPDTGGYVRVLNGPATRDLRILQDVTIPKNKMRTYELVKELFNNYALDEQSQETETEEEREEVHELLETIVDTPPMLVARQYVEQALNTTQSSERWYATLLELWFRRFPSGGDPALSGFEHVFVGEQEGAKVQGYHFWYKYWLDDGLADKIDGNPFPGLASDRIEYLRSEATEPQRAFPESVTIAYKWRAPDYEQKSSRPLTKPKGGFFVGCSVEGLMALGTVRAHATARAPKEAIIHGARYDLKIYRSPDNRHVRTFYPVFLGVAGEQEGEGNNPPAVTSGSVRIVAALVNPRGPDNGKETISLLNIGPQAIALANWKLIDKFGKAYDAGKLTLEPGVPGVIRIPRESIQLSNQGGKITLVDGSGRIVHSVSYTKRQAAREGETILF